MSIGRAYTQYSQILTKYSQRYAPKGMDGHSQKKREETHADTHALVDIIQLFLWVDAIQESV